MKTRLLLLVCALLAPRAVVAQGTAFTYQGRLLHGESVANGQYEVSFNLYDAVTNGNLIGTPITIAPLLVSNGLFTATLDFGSVPFLGADRWLEIAVTVFGSDQPVVTLTPRQPVLPVPYAIHAANAAGLMTFNNAPLDLKVNGERALRLEYTPVAPNLIGGFGGNVVSEGVAGATIAGGGRLDDDAGTALHHQITADYAAIGGGAGNRVHAYAATIAGGYQNAIEPLAHRSTIGGGFINRIETNTDVSTIAGGSQNRIEANAPASTIAGGGGNIIASGAESSFIGGGQINFILSGSPFGTIGGGVDNIAGAYAFVGGGENNRSTGLDATVGGGAGNRSLAGAATVGGGHWNLIEAGAEQAKIGGGGYNQILDDSFHSTISGGASNFMAEKVERSTIGGGENNLIGYFANATTIAGGMNNVIDGVTGGSTIGGGWFNHINEEASLVTIAGGGNNLVSDNAGSSVISGGEFNQVYASFGTVGGGQGNVILFPGHYAAIAGGLSNLVGNYYGTVAGGLNNEVRAQYAAIGGGQDNTIEAEADGSVIAGGSNNHIGANAVSNFIGGGGGNRIDAASSSAIVTGFDNHLGSYASVISGGRENGILENAEFSAIAGGENNHIADGSRNSAIGGGGNNQILVNSSHAMIPGGLENVATNLAFAAGKYAYAVHSGAFVWADASDVRFYSVSTNEFAVRATGGARFATAVDGTGTPTAGAELAPGSGTWSSLSDRNAKENFATADTREILDKVTALPMASWNYKAQGKDIRHLGPMAQDFHAAFGLGENDRTITTVDADGVALAAIQGLNAKLEEELKDKNSRISELERRLERIEKLLATASAR